MMKYYSAVIITGGSTTDLVTINSQMNCYRKPLSIPAMRVSLDIYPFRFLSDNIDNIPD